MRPGLEPRALGFLNLKPGPSLLKALAKPCLGPGLRGPGRAGLRALSPARHITRLADPPSLPRRVSVSIVTYLFEFCKFSLMACYGFTFLSSILFTNSLLS